MLGRVPACKLDDGTPLSENTAILPFLGSARPVAERSSEGGAGPLAHRLLRLQRAPGEYPHRAARALPTTSRPFPASRQWARFFHEYLKQIDAKLPAANGSPTSTQCSIRMPSCSIRGACAAGGCPWPSEELHGVREPHGEAARRTAGDRRREREALAGLRPPRRRAARAAPRGSAGAPPRRRAERDVGEPHPVVEPLASNALPPSRRRGSRRPGARA